MKKYSAAVEEPNDTPYNALGTGYTLTLTLSPEAAPDDIVEAIRQHVLPAKLQSCDGSEMKILLPIDAMHAFSGLFGQLETEKLSLGITAFGVSVTTMEEVFFR